MRIFATYYMHKRGGFCKRLYRALNALSARGHQVTFFTLDEARPPGLANGVVVRRIPFPFESRRGPFFWICFGIVAASYLAWKSLRAKPERLVAFGPIYALLLLPAGFTSRSPIILFVRSKLEPVSFRLGYREAFRALLDSLGIRCASRIIVQSFAGQISALQKGARTVAIIPNEVAAAPENLRFARHRSGTARAGPLKIMTSGLFVQSKNVEVLLEAAAELQRDQIEISVLIVGDGPVLVEYERLASELKVAHVTFPGWVEETQVFLNASDVYVHPSVHEGAPNSLLEALLFGLPVLGARIEEIEEILVSKRLLFNPRNPAELASKLRELATSSTAYAQAVDESFKAAERLCFDWDRRICEALE